MHPRDNTLGDFGRGKSGKPRAARWCTDFSWASEEHQGNYVFNKDIRVCPYKYANRGSAELIPVPRGSTPISWSSQSPTPRGPGARSGPDSPLPGCLLRGMSSAPPRAPAAQPLPQRALGAQPRPRREPGAPPSRSAPPPENARSPAHPARKRRLGATAHARSCRRCLAGAARDRHERVRGPVTASGMDCGSVTNERPKRRRRLLLSLVAGRGGGPGGRGVPTRHLLPGLLGGLGALRPRAPAARGGASRASPLLLLLLLPSPRLAAASPRRPLADWERSRAGPSAAPAGRGCARRCQPGLAPGVTCAAGALHLCLGQVAALASSRRGEGRGGGSWAGQPRSPGSSGRGDEGLSGPALWATQTWASSGEKT